MAEAGTPRIDALPGWPLPQAQPDWLGDRRAEAALREAFLGGRLHHAWLITGLKGIGKATLAYRFARFVLAHQRPEAVPAGEGLALPADHPAFGKVAGGSHPGLLTLERRWDERGKRFPTELTIGEVRRTVPFFGTTAGEGGWRICVVDPADDLNVSAANALLKVLEEPPARSLFLIVSHAPGRLLPTIRSRCRRLALDPLPAEVIARALRRHGADPADHDEAAAIAALSGGSLRQAIVLRDAGGLALSEELGRLLSGLPAPDFVAIHDFADRVAGRGADEAYAVFLDLLSGWLDRRVHRQPEPPGVAGPAPAVAGASLERWAEVWEKTERLTAEADSLNLDRKQTVLSIFMELARATRM